jgi:cell division protein FtsW (lipid II flippase)
MHLALLAAPIPAIAGSILLMHSANVSTSLLLQQAVIAAICIAVVLLTQLGKPSHFSTRLQLWVLAIVAFALLAPIFFATQPGPHRWVALGPIRLYVASFVLPMGLLCLTEWPNSRRVIRTLWILVVALTLAAQPDAAQATAFSIAALFALLRTGGSTPTKLLVLAGLSASLGWAWSQPDPLEPVAHVEGVLALAARHGVWALIAALISIAIPILVLVRQSQRLGCPGLAVVAVYYAVIYVFASIQITPMPFLGFGASPILGYFGMVLLLSRVSTKTLRKPVTQAEP